MTVSEPQNIKTGLIVSSLILGVIITVVGSFSVISLNLGDIEDVETSAIISSKQARRKHRARRYWSESKFRYHFNIDYIININDPLKHMDIGTYNATTLRLGNGRSKNIDLQRLNRIKRNEFTKEEQSEIDLFSDRITVRSNVYSNHNIGDEITVWYRADDPWTASYNLNTDRTNAFFSILFGLFFLAGGLFLAWQKDQLPQTHRPTSN